VLQNFRLKISKDEPNMKTYARVSKEGR